MIDRIKTAQGVVVAVFATMVAWWKLGLPRLVPSPELAQIHARIEALEPSAAALSFEYRCSDHGPR